MDSPKRHHLLRYIVYGLTFLSLIFNQFNASAYKPERHLKKGHQAFRASDLKKAVDHYAKARRKFDSLDRTRSSIKAARREFQVLVYTPLRDTTKGPVWSSLKSEWHKLKQSNPQAYLKTHLLDLNIKTLQKSNINSISEKLDNLQKNHKDVTPAEHPFLWTKIYGLKGKLLLQEQKLEKALSTFKKAEKAYEYKSQPSWVFNAVKVDHLFYRALTYRALSYFDSAKQCLDKGRSIAEDAFKNDHPIKAKLCHLYGNILRKEPKPIKANEKLNRGINILDKHNLIETPLGIKLYWQKGYLFSKNFHPEKAISYHKKALSLTKGLFPDKPSKLIYPKMALGQVFKKKGANEKALTQLKAAKKLAKKMPNSREKQRRLIDLNTNVSSLYIDQKDYKASSKCLEKAYQLAKKYYSNEHYKLGAIQINLMNNYKDIGNYEKAESHLNKAVDIYEKNYGPGHPKLGFNCYTNKAKLYRAKGHFDSSLNALKQAYSTFGNTSDHKYLPPQQHLIDRPLYALRTSAVHGDILSKRYHQTNNYQNLSKALKVYQFADSLVERLQQQKYISADQTSLAKQALKIYPAAVGTCYKLSSSAKSPKQKAYYQKQAFYHSEKSKTIQLLDGLNKVRQNRSKALPDSLRNKLDSLNLKINDLKGRQAKENSKAASIKDQLVDLKAKKAQFLERLKKQYPDFYAMSFHEKIVSIGSLQNTLNRQNKSLISYNLKDSLLYGICVTPKAISIKHLGSGKKLASDLETYRQKIAGNQNYNQQLSNSLYRQLYKPFEPMISHEEVVIIPDGPISHLAFGTLAQKTGKTQNPAYLIRDYAFTYSPSASLWMNREEKVSNEQMRAGSKNFIGFAPTFSSENFESPGLVAGSNPRQSLNAIPGAKEEVNFSSSLFKGAIRVGKKATEQAFKEKACKSQILHLATHGIVSDQAPAYSRLLFNSSGQSKEDGNLYTHELYHLDITADLAVLSACNTGYGPIKRGQGHMSLARGFKLAGCENVMMTLWQIRDQVSTDIVKNFYQNLAEGISKSRALREAKLHYLDNNDPNNSNPYFWGGFVLMGSNIPVQPLKVQQEKDPVWTWIIISGVLIVIASGLSYIGYQRYFMN